MEDVVGVNKDESWVGYLLHGVAPERRVKRATWEISGSGCCKCEEN